MKCILERKRKMMAEKTNFAGSQVHTIERKVLDAKTHVSWEEKGIRRSSHKRNIG